MVRRVLAAVTCSVTLAAAVLLPSAPASAEVGVDDYPTELRQTRRGGVVDPWRFYNRYCTSFVAWRINDVLGGTPGDWAFTNFLRGGRFSHARNWDENARRIGWRVDRRPAVGSIYQTETTRRGHVAVVTAIDARGRVLLEEYNLGDGAYHHHRWIDWRRDATADFIHVPGMEEALAGGVHGTRLDGSPRTLAPGASTTDVDGDGTDDLAVRVAGEVRFAGDVLGAVAFGRADDELFTADVDGDGSADLGLRRGRTMLFDTDLDGTSDLDVAFGKADDTLLVGDFDGDGDDEVGLHRGNRWMLNSDMRFAAEDRFRWGRDGDVPFTADVDGDGRTDLGLRRGDVVLVDTDRDRSVDHRIELGDGTLLVADIDGDGADELGVRDRGWFRFDTNLRGGVERTWWWGRADDTVLTGDFDGDGDDDVALRRGRRTIIDLDLDDEADLTVVHGQADTALLDPR